MTGGILGFLGGIGLFLFGMGVMTAALRDLAGHRMRHFLAHATRTPLRGTVTGLVATAAVQSSSVVSVITIGFVGAGVLSFPQSLGIFYGANIGSTFTGWLVMLLGVKFKLGVVALPALFVASVTGALGRGHIARAARLVAGLSLLFIGLDMMQQAMAGIGGRITPEMLPGDGVFGRIALAGVGVGLAVVLRSSAVGVAMALLFLGAGAITFVQAAALVVGLEVGTTTTGLLATIGGTRAMRMAGIANLVLNLTTALIALPLLGPIATLLAGLDAQTALVSFHTSLNLIGAAIFLPLTPRFAVLVARIVPDHVTGLASPLDRHLLRDEGAALDAAAQTARAVSDAIAQALSAAMGPQRDLRPLSSLPAQVDPALAALQDWLTRISVTSGGARYAALLHVQDHLQRLATRAQEADRIALVSEDAALQRGARALVAAMIRHKGPDHMARLDALLEARARRLRRATLLQEHAGVIGVPDLFRRTDALRWLERTGDHAQRIAFHMAQATNGLT
ncbi:MAG: Na/Pi symporter [Pseudomonadota bacterium]